MALDLAIFALILGIGSIAVYFTMKTMMKVVYWGLAVGITYILIKLFILS